MGYPSDLAAAEHRRNHRDNATAALSVARQSRRPRATNRGPARWIHKSAFADPAIRCAPTAPIQRRRAQADADKDLSP